MHEITVRIHFIGVITKAGVVRALVRVNLVVQFGLGRATLNMRIIRDGLRLRLQLSSAGWSLTGPVFAYIRGVFTTF